MPWKTLPATGVAVCLAITACVAPRTGVTLRVAVAPDANERTPVPVDLVFVWDKDMAGRVAALTAADWFATKPQLRQDDPDDRMLTVCEWEWVPGQAVPEINLAVPVAQRRWIRGLFVFANYRTPGPHRLRMAPGSASMLELGRADTALHPFGRSSSPAYASLEDACAATPPQARASS